MQHFVDAEGRFVFPEQLFPAVDSPLTVSAQRAAILSSRESLGWARDVLWFNDTWASMPPAAIDAACGLLRQLIKANGPDAAYAAYILGSASVDMPGSERRTLLRKAIKPAKNTGGSRAWYRVGVNADARGDGRKALSRFERGADCGDAACLYTLALAHMQGQFGLRVDVLTGVKLLERALPNSDPDFARAPYFLGKIMLGEAETLGVKALQNHSFPVDVARGLELVERSAFMGFSPALLRMADAYLAPHERGFDCAQAIRYLSLAASQDVYRRCTQRAPILRGAAEAQLVKWLLCGFENIIQKNEQWAFRFAEIGALDQNGSALFALAYFNEVGIATEQNTAKAQALYELSSARGCEAATTRLQQMGNSGGLRRTLTRKDHDRVIRTSSVLKGDAVTGMKMLANEEPVNEPVSEPIEPAAEPAVEPVEPVEPFEQTEYPSIKQSVPYPVESPDFEDSGFVECIDSPQQRQVPTGPISGSPERTLSLVSGPGRPVSIRNSQGPLQGYIDGPIEAENGLFMGGIPMEDIRNSMLVMDGPVDDCAGPYESHPEPTGPFEGQVSSVPFEDGLGSVPTGPMEGPTGPLEGPTGPYSGSGYIDARSAVSLVPTISSPSSFIQSNASHTSIESPPIGNLSLDATPYPSSPTGSEGRQGSIRHVSLPYPSSPERGRLPVVPAVGEKPIHNASSVESFRSAVSTPAEPPSPRKPDTGDAKTGPPITRRSPLAGPDLKPPEAGNSEEKPREAEKECDARDVGKRKRRPLSADWMRQSITGTRLFSASSNSLHSSLSNQSVSQPSIAQSSASLYEENKLRSPSPLRKIFGTTPEQRAAVARANRRSFTEAALAELASAPKVPVQPIKHHREPGVAYTFEEMGVETVAASKNDKCSVM